MVVRIEIMQVHDGENYKGFCVCDSEGLCMTVKVYALLLLNKD